LESVTRRGPRSAAARGHAVDAVALWYTSAVRERGSRGICSQVLEGVVVVGRRAEGRQRSSLPLFVSAHRPASPENVGVSGPKRPISPTPGPSASAGPRGGRPSALQRRPFASAPRSPPPVKRRGRPAADRGGLYAGCRWFTYSRFLRSAASRRGKAIRRSAGTRHASTASIRRDVVMVRKPSPACLRGGGSGGTTGPAAEPPFWGESP